MYSILLQKKHSKMIEFQETIRPFVPTIRQMAGVWGLKSLSATSFALNRLLDVGAVVYNGFHYYAVPFDWPARPERRRRDPSRNKAIIEMRKTHKAREVAEAFGITKQRVSQIVRQGR